MSRQKEDRTQSANKSKSREVDRVVILAFVNVALIFSMVVVIDRLMPANPLTPIGSVLAFPPAQALSFVSGALTGDESAVAAELFPLAATPYWLLLAAASVKSGRTLKRAWKEFVIGLVRARWSF